MVAANIMDTEGPRLTGESTLGEAVALLVTEGVARIPVVDSGGRVLGVLKEAALLDAALRGGVPASKGVLMDAASMERVKVSGLVQRDFKGVAPETPVAAIVEAFIDKDDPVSAVFVLDDKERLLGVITPVEVLKSQWKWMEKKR